jgi:competence protein ComEC
MTACDHYDVGGEFFRDGEMLRLLCRDRINRVHFSHWDLDHINLIKTLQHWLPSACIATPPNGSATVKKQISLHRLPRCKELTDQLSKFHKELRFEFSHLSSNSLSRIFVAQKQVLIPGDSTQVMEKQWAKLAKAEHIRILILGHHGSRTSTGTELLKDIAPLRISVSSSRSKKYGHPHKEVLQRLMRFSVPTLRTEDWGSILIQLNRNGLYSMPKSRATGS